MFTVGQFRNRRQDGVYYESHLISIGNGLGGLCLPRGHSFHGAREVPAIPSKAIEGTIKYLLNNSTELYHTHLINPAIEVSLVPSSLFEKTNYANGFRQIQCYNRSWETFYP